MALIVNDTNVDTIYCDTHSSLPVVTRSSAISYPLSSLNSYFPLMSDSWSQITNVSELSQHVGEYICISFTVTDNGLQGKGILKLNSVGGMVIYTDNIMWGYEGSVAWNWATGKIPLSELVCRRNGVDVSVYNNLYTNLRYTQTTRCKLNSGAYIREYTVQTSGTAVSGTSYYEWDSSLFAYKEVSIAEGESIVGYYKKYTPFEETDVVGVVIDALDTSLPDNIIVGKTRYGTEYYDTVGSMTLPTSSSNVSSVTICRSDVNIIFSVDSNGGGGQNVTTIKVIECAPTIKSQNAVSDTKYLGGTIGADIEFVNCTKISSNFLGIGTGTGTNPSSIYTVHNVTFTNCNITEIGDYAFFGYAAHNGISYANIAIPTSVNSIGKGNRTLSTGTLTNNCYTYRIQNSNLIWSEPYSNVTTIPNNTYGLTKYWGNSSFTEITLPNTIQRLTPYYSLGSYTANTTVTYNINSNIQNYECGESTTMPAFYSYAYIYKFGTNVTYIPFGAFCNQYITSIYISAPNGTNVNIETKAFYYKSSRAVNIYTDNQVVKDYDWATNQNITPTFYHLDGTAW